MQSEGSGSRPTPAPPAAANDGAPVGGNDGPNEAPADAIAATWRRIDAALSPIIGPLGMAALFRRSVSLARAGQPALAAVRTDAPGADPFASLHEALSGQTGPVAAEAQAALLQTFHDLLVSLIGASLTERLLRSAAAFPQSGAAAEDPTS